MQEKIFLKIIARYFKIFLGQIIFFVQFFRSYSKVSGHSVEKILFSKGSIIIIRHSYFNFSFLARKEHVRSAKCLAKSCPNIR